MDPTFSEDRNTAVKYVVFFDLDRTLTGEISGNVLVRMAWKKRQISLPDLLNAFYLYLSSLSLGSRDPLNIIDEMVSWVKGKPEALIEDLCREAFSEDPIPFDIQ